MFNGKTFGKSPALFYGLSFLLLLLLYGKSIGYDYVWDDLYLIKEDPYLFQKEVSWDLITRPVFTTTSYFRPLAFVSWWLEVRLWGELSPHLSHAVNVLVFYGTVLLVFQLTKRFLQLNHYGDRARPLATVATLIYLAHPANVETVVWLSGRFDLFATFFTLAAVLAFLSVKRPLLGALLILPCAVGALGSKETGILLLPLLLLLALYQQQDGQKSWGQALRDSWRAHRWLFLALLLLDGLYFAFKAHYTVGIYHRHFDWDYFHRFYLSDQVPVLALKEYVVYTLFPFGNQGYYNPIEYISRDPLNRVISWLVVLAVLGLLFWLWRRKNRLLLLFLAFFLGISLVIHLIPINTQGNLRQNRFLFIALPFATVLLALALGWATRHYDQFKRIPRWSVLALFGYGTALAVVCSVSIGYWKNDDTFWDSTSRLYQEYSDGQRLPMPAFNRLMQDPKVKPETIRELMLRETNHMRALGLPLELNKYTLYAQYFIRRHRSEEGLRMLEAYLADYEQNEGKNVSARQRAEDLAKVYSIYIEGLMYVRHDFLQAENYIQRLGELQPDVYQDSHRMNKMDALRMKIVNELLLDRQAELRDDWQRLSHYRQLPHNLLAPLVVVRREIPTSLRELCPYVPAPVPACAPDFKLKAYTEKLLHE